MRLLHRAALRAASAAIALSLLGAGSASAQNLIHAYEFNGNLLDALGGPAAINNGATVGATGLTFGNGQGPSLSGVLPVSVYSVEFRFSLEFVDGYRRLLDFKNQTTDRGLYVRDGGLVFFDETDNLPINVVAPNVSTHVVLTRSLSGLVTGYLNGVQRFQFDDSLNQFATFSETNSIGTFFRDDGVIAGENSPGFVDFIHVYDGVLSGTQVAALANSGGTAAAPEPGVGLFVGLGTISLVLARRRR